MMREIQVGDTYLDRLKKLIPAEVGAAFLTINASIPLKEDVFYYALGFFLILIPVCALYLRLLENVTSITQIAFISGIAFPIWALNIAVDRLEFMQNKLFLSSGLLVLVTLFIPLVVKK